MDGEQDIVERLGEMYQQVGQMDDPPVAWLDTLQEAEETILKLIALFATRASRPPYGDGV